MPKTIGILGGMGSFATLHFFKTLLELSEPDEFRIVIDNAVHILERTKAVKEDREGEVFKGITNSFVNLSRAKCDLVVVPCNQAHYWYDRIVHMFGMPWLNMIEIVSDTVTKKGYSRPLILGGYVTVTKKLYSEYLPNAIYLDGVRNDRIYKAIKRIKNDPAANSIVTISRIICGQIVENPHIDSIILACTELPIVVKGLNRTENGLPVIDSSLELAKAAIKYARRE